GLVRDRNVILGARTGRPIRDHSLRVGRNARVRSGTVIYGGTSIGDDLQTGHNVVIREENRIGDALKIWNNSCIDYGCTIGNNVRIHNNVYVCQYTEIGDDVFLAPGVMLANDKYPVRFEGLKGPTIGRGAIVGMNATLMPEVKIGDEAVIGAGSVVTKDVPARRMAFGNPARVVGTVDAFQRARAGSPAKSRRKK
ncbi:MAG: N-acetyltransferase, partial [Planctomycetes bacterium]|nr:N-acetyltransferase [Planctomycetota bacterium]